MDIIKSFLSEYGAAIIYAIVTGVAAIIGMGFKKLYKQHVDTETKEKIVKRAVQMVEQLYKDLHGEEKLEQALIAATQMLNNAGIEISDIELRWMIEGAVGEFNNAFAKPVVETPEGNLSEPDDVDDSEDCAPDEHEDCESG